MKVSVQQTMAVNNFEAAAPSTYAITISFIRLTHKVETGL